MKKDLNKAIALSLAGAMVMTVPAMAGEAATEGAAPVAVTELSEEDAAKAAAEVFTLDNYDVNNWTDESTALYSNVLGDFLTEYTEAKEADTLAERFAKMAVSEAKMLESSVMIPLTTRGGMYAISRVAPRSMNTTLWGSDNYRMYSAIVATEPIKPADWDALKSKWEELKGTGTYLEEAKAYLTEQGYELVDNYASPYVSDPVTWDILATSQAADTEPLVNTYDGLMEYDAENEQQPALAESYEVSEDGLTYTFHLREGVKWVDSQGREVADVVADDFVAGMQHMMDAAGGLEYLLGASGANVVNADAYLNGEVTDFAEVGVKAVDDYTVEYTLEEPCSFFMTMLGYSVFAPMSRTYYESQGGQFGYDYNKDDANFMYGKDPDHIAYCGPFLITNATEKNTITFKANPTYWNPDALNVHELTWLYNDGTDATKTYNDMKAGTIAGCSLTTATIETAKKEGLFDELAHTSQTEATSFMGFMNLNRKTFANFNDASVAVSEKTAGEAVRTTAALQNLHFRRALVTSLDRASFNAQSQGEDLKLNSLRNSYVPGDFVSLDEDVTIDINGEATEFKAGTFFGEIVQAQITADGLPVQVWDAENLTSDGFDGWYNTEYAASEIEAAAAELGEAGVTVDESNPIYIDLPYFSGSEIYTNRANVFKQSVEAALGGKVVVNLVKCESSDDWSYAGYYPEAGYQFNADVTDVSGWGPDYGDPQTYLDTLLPDYAGYMTKAIGLF